MIQKPEDMNFSDHKFSMIIYGSPGTGKTTMALSAPKPILLDFDRGISRVRAEHRKPTSICNVYEEVLADIHSPEMAEFETVVIDTGGSFITFLKDWAMRTKAGVKSKNGEFNGRIGYGFVKNEFAAFTEELKTRLHKNVIYVFHSVESADKDGNPIQRLMCEGSTKNTVWTPCDFGGYVQMVDTKRVICFTPEQEFFAKGCHGITGRREIPTLEPGKPNDFITRLFEEAKANIQAENDVFAPQKEAYEQAMVRGREIIASVTDADSANAAMPVFKAIPHSLTSQKELGSLWNARCKELGLFYDKVLGAYTPAPAAQPGPKEG